MSKGNCEPRHTNDLYIYSYNPGVPSSGKICQACNGGSVNVIYQALPAPKSAVWPVLLDLDMNLWALTIEVMTESYARISATYHCYHGT